VVAKESKISSSALSKYAGAIKEEKSMGKKFERIEVIDGEHWIADEEESEPDTPDDDLKRIKGLVRSGKDRRAIMKHPQRRGTLPPGTWGRS